jgi:DNA-directed RNA polymerase specialized sigma24 family protein
MVWLMHDAQGTITGWIAGLKHGKSQCARRLHHYVFERLVRLANRRLAGAELHFVDGEDAALSAFRSFCERVSKGKFSKLENRDDLWKILVRITARKAGDYVRRERRQKRRSNRNLAGDHRSATDSASRRGGVESVLDNGPTPDMVLVIAEECERLLAALEDEQLAQIAIWKMERYTDAGVAHKLGCVVRTVERKVNRIRAKWSKLLPRTK